MRKPWMQGLVCIIAIIIVLTGYFFYRHVSNRTEDKPHRVYYDEQFFQNTQDSDLYEPGSLVELKFPTKDTDFSYTFQVVGVKNFDTNFEPGIGYTIQFKMPRKYVSVYYQIAEPFDGIAIEMDENPTTGFEWVYEIEPDGLVSLVEDRYVSDAFGEEEPVDGAGGTHYWKFKVVDNGTVEIRFQCLRGDEELYGSKITYRYACEDGKAVLVEKTSEEK